VAVIYRQGHAGVLEGLRLCTFSRIGLLLAVRLTYDRWNPE